MSERVKNRIDVFFGRDLKQQIIVFARKEMLTQSGAVKHMVRYFFQNIGQSQDQPNGKFHHFTREPESTVEDRLLQLEDQVKLLNEQLAHLL